MGGLDNANELLAADSVVLQEWLPEQLRLASAHEEQGRVTFEGTEVHYLRWRKLPSSGTATWDDVQPLVLVHGGGANGYWWKFLAPALFSEDAGFDIVAPTFSGSGESGWRDDYSLRQWGDEVLHVATELFAAGSGSRRPRPIVVAHSLGGLVMSGAALRQGELLGGLVCMDNPIFKATGSVFGNVIKGIKDSEGKAAELEEGGDREAPIVHPNEDSPYQRFVLKPKQPIRHRVLTDFIAEASCVRLEAPNTGWFWKGDPNRGRRVMANREGLLTTDEYVHINKTKCRVAYVFGKESALVQGTMLTNILADMAPHMPVIGIPSAAHHLWLDEPIATASVLASILAFWKVSPKL